MGEYSLKRGLIRGKPRIEKDCEVWIARTIDGREIFEPGYRWNTRCGAWHACWEADNIPPRSAKP